jgi:hypothetical protein
LGIINNRKRLLDIYDCGLAESGRELNTCGIKQTSCVEIGKIYRRMEE